MLLALLALQFRRFIGAQVFIFDKGRSARAAVLAMGGERIELGREGTLSLQPLARIDEPGEIAFALRMGDGAARPARACTITPEVKDAVWTALQSLASAPKAERTLTGLAVLIQSNALVAALAPYTLEGAYGRLLDGCDGDAWRSTDVLHFEMEELMQHKALVAPVLTYLFHRLEARFDGRPTLLILDEAWIFLDDPLFAARIREWLKTLRKKNVAVVFATQSLADIERSIDRAGPDRELPDAHLPAQRPGARAAGARRLRALRSQCAPDRDPQHRATPKRDYYAQTARGNRLFELGLGPVALALCGASSPDDQTLIDRCLADDRPTSFAARVPPRQGAGLGGRADRALRRATQAPTAPASVHPDRSGRRCAASRCHPAAARHTFAEGSGAGRRPRTDAAPLPGLPGGPPMPERLSPYPPDATQAQEERPMRPLRKPSLPCPSSSA